jgi:hypothetical protein
MPKTILKLEVEVDHPEKCSNNITSCLCEETIAAAVVEATGASGATLKKAIATPVEEGISSQSAGEKDHPA